MIGGGPAITCQRENGCLNESRDPRVSCSGWTVRFFGVHLRSRLHTVGHACMRVDRRVFQCAELRAVGRCLRLCTVEYTFTSDLGCCLCMPLCTVRYTCMSALGHHPSMRLCTACYTCLSGLLRRRCLGNVGEIIYKKKGDFRFSTVTLPEIHKFAR